MIVILAAGLIAYAGIGGIEPTIKPVIVKDEGAWTIKNDTGLHVVGYYCRVKMPDGSVQELKSKTQLDAKGWDALALKFWEATKPDPNKPEPKVCPYCGGTGWMP